MVSVVRVEIAEMESFRRMAEGYWQELMPSATVINSPERRKTYFREQFSWDEGDDHPYWGVVEGERIGFLAFAVSVSDKRAQVSNLYVFPGARRKGYGTAMVQWLYAHLDELGVERIDLDVRRDNLRALSFWRAQGFGISGYRMRQYRDPQTGTAYAGALSSDYVSLPRDR